MSDNEIINPIGYSGWDNLVLSSDSYSFFHSSAWARVLSESYRYKPVYFTSYCKDRLLFLMPLMEIKTFLTAKRAVSLPFTDYVEPIHADGRQFQDTFDHIFTYAKKANWKYLELRGAETFLADKPPYSYYYIHILRLSENVEETLRKFRSSTKRNINKAMKEGVAVGTHNSTKSMEEFYRLHCITRKKHGFPPQPYYFFEKIADHIITKDRGIIVLASYKNEVIAANVYFHFGKKAVYKYGASDTRYHHLRANNLVMWEAIKWYCQHGYESFCFGRTDPKNIGLLQFKSGWGTKQEIVKYYKYLPRTQSFISNDSNITYHSQKIFNKLPIPLLRLIGSALYPHLG